MKKILCNWSKIMAEKFDFSTVELISSVSNNYARSFILSLKSDTFYCEIRAIMEYLSYNLFYCSKSL